MAIKESAKDWYKDMHEGVYANMSKGIVPIKSPDEDSIVKSVRDKYQERSDVGKLKYGKTLDRKDLTMKEWLNHLQEEFNGCYFIHRKVIKRNTVVMIMESLVTLMAIIAFIILGTISHALMQDITDPITGRTVRDKEARRMGMFGYALCIVIVFLLYRYLFG